MDNNNDDLIYSLIEGDATTSSNNLNVRTPSRRLAALTIAILGVSGLALLSLHRSSTTANQRAPKKNTLTTTETKWHAAKEDVLEGPDKLGNFGYDVAMSDEGEILVVGEPYIDDESVTGKFRVFRKDEEGKYDPLGEAMEGDTTDDYFGYAVAVTINGTWIAAAAPKHENSTGIVHLFETNLTTNKIHKRGIVVGDAANDNFGHSIALSDHDGTTRAVVGAPGVHGEGRFGYVRILELDGERKVWEPVGLDIVMGEADGGFGYDVAVNDCGSVVAVGAPHENSVGVYVEDEGDWVMRGPAITVDDEEDAMCGSGVGISANGKVVVVGCERSSIVHSYHWNGEEWKYVGKGIEGDDWSFGTSVAMDAKGSRLVLGDPFYGSEDEGRAVVYGYDKDKHDWVLIGHIEDKDHSDFAGTSVAISPDGYHFAMGAPDHTAKNVTECGVVGVFKETTEE